MAVCFTGHRKLEESVVFQITAALDHILEVLYEKGFRRYFCGGAIGFDMLAEEAVLRLQIKHPDVKLIIAVPCIGQEKQWSHSEQTRYKRLLYEADEVRVLSSHYYQGCMLTRDRYMVDRSSYCVCWMEHLKGGTAYTVSYAVKSDLTVLNLALEDVCIEILKGS